MEERPAGILLPLGCGPAESTEVENPGFLEGRAGELDGAVRRAVRPQVQIRLAPGRLGRRGPRRGADLRVRLPLTLEEVATGTKKTLKIQVMNPCTGCSGTGATGGTVPR